MKIETAPKVEKTEKAETLLWACAWCEPRQMWLYLNITHGICPACKETVRLQIEAMKLARNTAKPS